MKKRYVLLGGFAVAAAVLFALNASFLAKPRDDFAVLAHRGVFQTYDKTGVGRGDCTAKRIFAPTPSFLESSTPSMQAAIDAGAAVIEIDIHPKTDSEFAVFHDWTIDCGTNGKGVTRERTWATLKALDIGHGYTADGGKTFPFRGKFIGAMANLGELLCTFPDQRFLINIKSRDVTEADRLDAYRRARADAKPERLTLFGRETIVARLRELRPGFRATGRAHLKPCAKDDMLTGWTGHMPATRHDTVVYLPVNWAWAAWGYRDRLLERMQKANTDVVLQGPLKGRALGMKGVDDASTVAMILASWRGGVATDRVEVTGPLLYAARRAP